MKVKLTSRSEKEVENREYRGAFHIDINDGERKLKFSDGEPEDSNLSRDFSDVYSIPEVIKLAHEAGRNGETLEFIEEESDEI